MSKATDNELDSIIASIESGEIDSETRQTLMKYNSWLCHGNSASHFGRNYEPTCETVRLHLLRTFMEGLEGKNAETQKWVIVLAVAALISSIVQIFSPMLFQSQYTASIQQTPPTTKVKTCSQQPH